MKILKYAGSALLITAAIFAANTSLTLESCQRSSLKTAYTEGSDRLSPNDHYNNIKKTTSDTALTISDEATDAAEKIKDTSRDISENGKNIAGAAANGTASVAKDAKDTYVGLLSYFIGDIRQSWINLIGSLGGNTDAFYEEDSENDKENNLVIDVEETENRNKQKLKEAWETSNHFDKSDTKGTQYSEKSKKLPYTSKDVKKNCTDYLTTDIQVVFDGSTADIPAYDGTRQVIEINDGKVFFDTTNLSTDTYESYSDLDSLGRTGYAEGCFGPETINRTKRESLGMYKPSGFCQHKYDCLKSDKNPQGFAMARLHLLMRAFGGNDQAENLISGTFSANDYRGMEKYEMEILDYIYGGGHVKVCSLPVYGEDNLLAYGILYQAKSIEDDSVEINIFIYNADPSLVIDYSTGDNREK